MFFTSSAHLFAQSGAGVVQGSRGEELVQGVKGFGAARTAEGLGGGGGKIHFE